MSEKASDELANMVQNTINDLIDEAIDDDKFCLIENTIISESTIRTPIVHESAAKEVETEDDDIKIPKYKESVVNLIKRDIYHKGKMRRRQEGFYHPDTGQFIKHGHEFGFFETGEVEFEVTWYENKKRRSKMTVVSLLHYSEPLNSGTGTHLSIGRQDFVQVG
jgi:hypothetical protein